MDEQNFWQRLIAAVNREYERRVRAASLLEAYGVPAHSHTEPVEDDDPEGTAVIANVPRGTRLAHPAPAEPPEPRV